MKIQRIHLGTGEGLGILTGFDYQFNSKFGEGVEPLCLVGQNGSGKSRLLQCLAEIFYDLDYRARSGGVGPASYPIKFTYEIDYLLREDGQDVPVRVKHPKAKGKPVLETLKKEIWTPVEDIKDWPRYLPDSVVGYTSGQNETLSWPFFELREQYAKAVAEAALYQDLTNLERYQRPRLEMVDYNLNLAAIVSMYLMRTEADDAAFADLANFARIETLDSFRFVVRRNHQAARKIRGVKFTPQHDRYVDAFRKCATCWDYDEAEESWIFDFRTDEETRRALYKYFKSPWALFSAFQRLEMLNYLMVDKNIRAQYARERSRRKLCEPPPQPYGPERVFEFQEVKLKLKGVAEPADYILLSDGEHQLAHILCTLRMYREGNVLFLLDEPESHFNPLWRVEFVKMANNFLRGDTGAHALILSTHAVFVLSDCRKENVYVFRRKEDGKTIEVVKPKFETYGASFDWLLEQIFQVIPPIARKALQDLESLREKKPEDALKELDRFGESLEKVYTMEYLDEAGGKKA